ncbi:hypothetical protein [Streptomyces coelicoflavus]|uniref:hypothetical protein n=1 Tax=Streptomyces coelicoflavus TaxID=285562 RepID=UPI003691BC33
MTLPAPTLGTAHRRPERRRRIGPTLVLTAISLFTVAPLLAVVALALSPEDAPTLPHALPDSLTFDNITRIFDVGEFPRWLWNSVVYSVVSVLVILLTAPRWPPTRWCASGSPAATSCCGRSSPP